jgi:Mg-chelatase subunit ChlD/tetratricopeptide (TPR) repeat protein
MNDSSNSLPPSGDDALEARIVAWVLGEASPFEAAELEKLCSENPELRDFERRTRDLHEILAADATPGMGAAWKLPAGKREKVTDLLGVELVEPVGGKVNRYFARRILLAAAACVAISLVSYPLFSGSGSKAKVAMAPEKTVDFMAESPGVTVSSDSLAKEAQVEKLRRAVVEQEERVEDKRQLLAQQIRQGKVVSDGSASMGSRSDESAARNYAALEQEKVQLEQQVETLLKYDGPQLMSYASGLTLPDNVIPQLLPQYQEAKRDYDAMKSSGLAAGHPSIVEKEKVLQMMETDLEAAAADLRGTLTKKLDESKKELAGLEARMDAKSDLAIHEGIDSSSYNKIQNDFDNEEQQLEELRLKLVAEETKAEVRGADPSLALNDSPAPAAPAMRPPVTAMPVEPRMELPELAKQEAGGASAEDLVTGGLRSGDRAVNRNNLDAIVDNPNRVAVPGQASGDVALAKDTTMGRGFAQAEGQLAQLGTAMPKPASGPAQVEAGERLQEQTAGGVMAGKSIADEQAGFGLLTDSVQGGLKRDLSLDPAATANNMPALVLGPEDPLTYRFSRAEIVPRKPGEMPVQEASAPDGYALNIRSRDLAWADSGAPGVVGGAWGGGGDRSAVAAAEKFFFGVTGTASTSKFTGESDQLDEPRQLVLGGELSYKDRTSGLTELQPGVQLAPAMPPIGSDPESNPLVAGRSKDRQTASAEEVHLGLHQAEGAYNLGKYDDASKAYEDVLRVDPYNNVARRGLERVAQAKTDYYRAAYDHTRAQLLSQVDAAWELSVPPVVATPPPVDAKVEGGVSELAQKEMARRQTVAAEADRFVEEGRKARETGDLEAAYKLQTDALGLMPEAPAVDARRAEVKRSLGEIAAGLAVDAEAKGKKDAAKEWAGKALQWNPEQKDAKGILNLGGGDETSTAAEPFSTFSLHVSDASFKLAKAALDRGEQPDPAGIRPEEFYNAFDYGDPAPAQGEPVVCVTEQAAHPVLPQRNLVRVGVRTSAEGRGGSVPLNLTLLLDSSGSMEREDRQAAMLRAVEQLSGLLKEGDTITMAGFARQPRLLADRLPGARAQELNKIIAQTPSEGGTNLEEGLKLAEELAKRQFNPAAQNRIVLFTDGAANLGDAQPESLQARVEQLRQEGIAFDAAGFGADGLNDRLLERLTRNGNGRYYVVDRAEDAGEGFAKQLAGAFRPAAENVKVQVRFNPARVARYKLIGFEEHRLAKEDFKNDAVDAAEMAAEEAGNALYQIEPIPGGEGEIGDVSVRFRDVASGQMIERTWTISYEAQAPAFDQAAPSMQLAGLAAFAAEKLRKAPMADALDFQQLGKSFAPVKAKYAGSGAVEELGQMIEKLK